MSRGFIEAAAKWMALSVAACLDDELVMAAIAAAMFLVSLCPSLFDFDDDDADDDVLIVVVVVVVVIADNVVVVVVVVVVVGSILYVYEIIRT